MLFLRTQSSRHKRLFTTQQLLIATGLLIPTTISSAEIVTHGIVTPTDPTTWTSETTARIGRYGDGYLTVNNGSTISSGEAIISSGYYDNYGDNTDGTVTISDLGSVWSNANTLYVGYQDSCKGKLKILNGGCVNSRDSYIGYQDGYAHGEVLVNGENSTWHNTGLLNIGGYGYGKLDIINGAKVYNTDGYIGYVPEGYKGYAKNPSGMVTVSGAASLWENTGALHLGFNGTQAATSSLYIRNQATVNNTNAFLSYGQSTCHVIIHDNATWNNSENLYVGYTGNARLELDNGKVNNTNGYIGHGSNTNSSVIISGSDSKWNNSDYLYVGYGYSSDARLEINDGQVNSVNGYIGYDKYTDGIVVVSGSDAEWNNDETLHVGYKGDAILNIHSGSVHNTNARVGYSSGSSGTVEISGSDATWNNRGDLQIGGYKANGVVTIRNNGTVLVAGDTILESNGTLIIEGENDALHTGSLKASNLDSIKGLGTINSYGIYDRGHDWVFDATNGTQRTLTLSENSEQNITVNLDFSGNNGIGNFGVGYYEDGSLIVKDNARIATKQLRIGRFGIGTLAITNGGIINSTAGYIDGDRGIFSTAKVNGSGSTWNCDNSLILSDSKIEISNGGTVNSKTARIAGHLNDVSTATIDGPDASWNMTGELQVLANSAVIVKNGATLNSYYAELDAYNTNYEGTVIVNGNKSTWNDTGQLVVGYEAKGLLKVNNGGTVNSNIIIIGKDYYEDSHWGTQIYHGRGTVHVDGADSQINCAQSVYVGSRGTGTLNITNGGTVTCDNGFIAYSEYSNQRGRLGTVTVEGINSNWNINNDLKISDHYGSANLNIANGASVNVGGKTIAARPFFSTGAYTNKGFINFENGGTLNTSSLYAHPTQLSGTGIINTKGWHHNQFDWHFNANTGLTQSVILNSEPDQSIAINLDVSGKNGVGNFSIGYERDGVMTINDGLEVSFNQLYIGFLANGTVLVDDASTLNCTRGSIGDRTTSQSSVTLDNQSIWNISEALMVGNFGTGTLNIFNGSQVNVNGDTYVRSFQNSYDTINFGDNGGTLSTHSLAIIPSHLTGNGTVNTCGWTDTDQDWVFDKSTGATQTILLNESVNQNVTVNMDLSGTRATGDIHIGSFLKGSLLVKDGVNISSKLTFIGKTDGSEGTAIIAGQNTVWNNEYMRIGENGFGKLVITNGSIVNTGYVDIARYSDSKGIVKISGNNTVLNSSNSIYIGSQGAGIFSISDFAKVQTKHSLHVAQDDLLAINISNDNMAEVGGWYTAYGTVRLNAGTDLQMGDYRPITASTWRDSTATYEAFGGTWDSTNHIFTASPITSTTDGANVTVDLSTSPRINIDDKVIANFKASTSSQVLQFSATQTDVSILNDLLLLIDKKDTLRMSWDFNIVELPVEEQVILSFAISKAFTQTDITLWHYNGSWSQYKADDLVVSNGWATFAVNNLSSYAISAIPEPSSLMLLLASLILCYKRNA